MQIVIDSNIWISELGLSTAKGLALQFFVKRKNGVIAIPEIVKREVEMHIRDALTKHCNDIRRSHRQLLSIFGSLKEVVLPDDQAINECVLGIFENISVDTRNIPFSIESASHSLDKVIMGLPPSGPKNQQFKDGVIWADCLELLESDAVILVTDDRGFYENKQIGNGRLATNLQKEASQRDNNIQIFGSITDLLEEVQEPVDIDESALTTAFCDETQDSFGALLERNGFELFGEPTVKISAYVTEKTDHLYIEFEIIFRCNDLTDEKRTQAILTLRGETTFEASVQEFLGFRNQGESLEYIDADGEQQQKNVHLMVGNVVIGHRTVEHVVRHKIT